MMAVAVPAVAALIHSLLFVVVGAQFEFDYAEGKSPGDYKVFWNVPTFQCHKYGLNFSSVSKKWGILQNEGDAFRGNTVAILYDPGLFPALLPTTSGGAPEVRNGGVPQAGNLSLHLDRFSHDLERLLPDRQFKGVGIIDFEHWRPIWRQNWMSLAVYRNYSRHLERRRHPRWSKQDVEKEAAEQFEAAAAVFLRETLLAAKAMRRGASWGYYGFPFCFNNKPAGRAYPCTQEVIADNNRLQWLFSESTALFPSVYLSSGDMSERANQQYIASRVAEATRVAAHPRTPVYAYIWPKYRDSNRFLSKVDLYNSVTEPRRRGAAGVVVWGATKDVNSRAKCVAMFDYLQTQLGPTVLDVAKAPAPSGPTDIFQIFGK